jgi:hypothetical protein
MEKSGAAVFVFLLFGSSVTWAGDLPSPQKTPGDTFPVTKEQLCQAGYTACVRHVPKSMEDAIFKSYGVKSHKPKEYEIDHLISLEIGGSNDEKNLWPQSYITEPLNAHTKDFLENKLNELVCTNQMPLSEAQHLIATDWIKAFNRYGGSGVMKHPKISKTECAQLHKQFATNR